MSDDEPRRTSRRTFLRGVGTLGTLSVAGGVVGHETVGFDRVTSPSSRQNNTTSAEGPEGPPDGRPMIVGHRGAAGLEPPNTMASIERALEIGVDGVEIDIRQTQDGELILFHDPVLDIATEESGLVEHTPYSTIEDARVDGESIPTLEQGLDRLEQADVELFLELKSTGISRRVLDRVLDRGLKHRTTIVAFESVKLRPSLKTGVKTGLLGKAPNPFLTDEAVANECKYVLPHFVPEVFDRFVAKAEDAGVSPGVWSLVGTEWNIERAINDGVHVLTTNRPDIAFDVLDDRKQTE